MGRIARVADLSNVNNDFDHLDGAGRLTAHAALAPRPVTYGLVVLLVVGSWFILLAMASQASMGASGPGAEYLRWFPDIDFPPLISELLALCLSPASTGHSGLAIFVAVASMWFLMSVAMMLPSAAPLIRTYCEIADTARAADKSAAHPLWLVSGFLAVWLAAAVLFAGVGWIIAGLSGSETTVSPAIAPVSAAALALAGLYQFSGLKHACLTKCRNPFSTLFANWSDKPADIFFLGVKQGLWCVGCCWALMLVMFAVGVMNVFWMALLAVITAIEKTVPTTGLSRITGVILLVWAMAVLFILV